MKVYRLLLCFSFYLGYCNFSFCGSLVLATLICNGINVQKGVNIKGGEDHKFCAVCYYFYINILLWVANS